MRNKIIVMLMAGLLLVACQLSAAAGSDGETIMEDVAPASQNGGGACGDGLCEGPENYNLCPEDCPPDQGNAPAPTKNAAVSADRPMFLTTMTHMEHGWDDDTDQAVFLQHVEELRYGLRLANEYDAKFTVESEIPFSTGAQIWGVNALQEVLDLGHGVGTHSDINSNKSYTINQLTQEFLARKEPVDALVGPENNRGTSGGGCPGDWVTAASRAGFVYMDGVVGMHLLGVPLSARPGPEWTDEYIHTVGYHTDIPLELEDRLYPFRLADTQDFVPDTNGLVLLTGDIGRLDHAAEGGAEACRPEGSCAFTDEDADVLADTIRYADSIRDRSRIAKLTIYLPASLFQPANEGSLRHFLRTMKDLADQGVIVWATQGQVYDAYVGI